MNDEMLNSCRQTDRNTGRYKDFVSMYRQLAVQKLNSLKKEETA